MAIQADMSDKKAIDQLVKEVIEKFGKIDIWINNAGADILTGDYANANKDEKLEKLTETDLKGTINAFWSVAEGMNTQQNGVIVNMGWIYQFMVSKVLTLKFLHQQNQVY